MLGTGKDRNSLELTPFKILIPKFLFMKKQECASELLSQAYHIYAHETITLINND